MATNEETFQTIPSEMLASTSPSLDDGAGDTALYHITLTRTRDGAAVLSEKV
jgi:hypothetical protein